MTDRRERLAEAISALQPGQQTLPSDFPRWDDLMRMILDEWANGMTRDMNRAEAGLGVARQASGRAPSEEELAALEECFWRLACATDKFDSLVALTVGATPLRPRAQTPTRLQLRFDEDANKARLREIETAQAETLIKARAEVNRGNAATRRNQIAHSLAPLADLNDLALLCRIVHRDGRIMMNGYVLERWAPDDWDDGIKQLSPESLFARRLEEASQGVTALEAAVNALADFLESDAVLHEPQRIYWDFDTHVYTLERPASQGPATRYEVEFVLRDDPESARVVSCESEPLPGVIAPFDGDQWRVIWYDRLEDERLDARATCIRVN